MAVSYRESDRRKGSIQLGRILVRIRRHQKPNENYIDQGIRLLELARNAAEFYRTHGQEERAILLRFILQGSTLKRRKVVPVFKPPFDIIHGLAEDARKADRQGTSLPDKPSSTKNQAAGNPTTCPFFLPRLDEFRTFSFEHEIEEVPHSLA